MSSGESKKDKSLKLSGNYAEQIEQLNKKYPQMAGLLKKKQQEPERNIGGRPGNKLSEKNDTASGITNRSEALEEKKNANPK